MAQSSEMRFGSQDSKVCCICQRRVVLIGEEPLAFYTRHRKGRPSVSLSWHVACGSPGWPHLKDAA